MNTTVKSIAKKLKIKRESLGLPKNEVAKRLSLGRNFLLDVENGKETAQIGKVAQYAEGLNLQLILKDKNDPLGILEDAISIAYKKDKALANRLIMALTDDEKSQMSFSEVRIRRKSSIKRLTLELI